MTLAIAMAIAAVRMLRDNLIEVLDSEYVRMAELKGLPPRAVLLRHALPNALVPTLNVTAINLGYLIGGVVIVEKVFSYPGFGRLLVDSLQLRDMPLIEATVLIAAAVYVGANLLADLGAILLNPRLREAVDAACTLMVMASDQRQRSGRRSGRCGDALPMSLRIGAIILLLHFVVAATGPFWAPYGPSQIGTGPPLSGMSWAHPFGVDQLGRDVFSRAVHGSHIVILLSLSGTFLGLVIGAIVGLLSGYVRGWIDEILQRVARSDHQHSLPGAGADRDRRRGAGAFRQSHAAGPGHRASSMRRASRAWRARQRSIS